MKNARPSTNSRRLDRATGHWRPATGSTVMIEAMIKALARQTPASSHKFPRDRHRRRGQPAALPQITENVMQNKPKTSPIYEPTDEPVATPVAPESTDTAVPVPTDPFDDLDSLRLDQSFVETAGARKLLLTVPVGKPNRQDFCRVHPSEKYSETVALIELKEDRAHYLLLREVAQNLPNEFASYSLHTAINRQGVVFLWPVRLPPPGKTPLA